MTPPIPPMPWGVGRRSPSPTRNRLGMPSRDAVDPEGGGGAKKASSLLPEKSKAVSRPLEGRVAVLIVLALLKPEAAKEVVVVAVVRVSCWVTLMVYPEEEGEDEEGACGGGGSAPVVEVLSVKVGFVDGRIEAKASAPTLPDDDDIVLQDVDFYLEVFTANDLWKIKGGAFSKVKLFESIQKKNVCYCCLCVVLSVLC